MEMIFIRHGEPDKAEVDRRGVIGLGRELAPLTGVGIRQAGEAAEMEAGEEMNAMQMRRPEFGPGGQPPFDPERRPPEHRPPRPKGPGHRPPFDPGRRSLLEVLLYNEMYRRRCKQRRARRFW